MSRFRAAAVLVVALVAASCGTDDEAQTPSSTTVPVAGIEAPASSTTDGADDGADPEPPAVPHGDLTRAAVALADVAVLDAPIDTTVLPTGELWVALRGGRVVVVDHRTGAIGDTVLDLSAETTTDAERGLLGLANDGEHLYVNLTDPEGDTLVDAFVLDDAGRPGERRRLLSIEQPFSNHNGGGLEIGPDGHLYIGVGDGGGGGDPLAAGQDPTQILGSILRIAPTPGADEPYAIPADNPFADGAEGRPEIYAIGARNPWRFSFDPATGDFWVADVGQNEWEEVDLMLAANGGGLGANLGWNLREGTREFSGARPEGNVDPVFEYPHSGGDPTGCSVSGGQVYRGTAIPDLVGAYVFGDWCADTLWALSVATGEVIFRDLGAEIGQLVDVGVDPEGELLAVSLEGRLSRVVPG